MHLLNLYILVTTIITITGQFNIYIYRFIFLISFIFFLVLTTKKFL